MGVIKTYFVALVVFFCIDMIWLVVVARKMYQKDLGYIMSDKVNWVAAILFYLIFIAGLVFFVIDPSMEKESLKHAILAGMFFGLVSYATYDLTNLATIRNWPLKTTVIDLIWGTALGGTVSAITVLILKKL